MLSEHRLTGLSAGLLGCMIAFGSALSPATAFDLQLAHPAAVFAAWTAAAFLSAWCFRRKHGAAAVLCLLAFLAGYILRQGIAAAQFHSLFYRIGNIYDSAYGWGLLPLRDNSRYTGFADWPLGILGCLVAVTVSHRVCTRKSSWPAVLTALLPVAPCVVVTDTVPHPAALFFLISGLVLLILTGYVRQENEHQGLRLTAMAVSPVLLAVLALFLAFPQERYVDRSSGIRRELLTAAQDLPRYVEQLLENTAAQFPGRMPSQIDLRSVGPHIPLTNPVMDVRSDAGGILYLRGQDFDTYTGTGWISSDRRAEDFCLPGGKTHTVTLRTRREKSMFYVPYYPAQAVSLADGKAANPDRLRQYTFSCTTLPENWRILTAGNAETPVLPEDPCLRTCLTLPESTRQEASAMVEALAVGTHTEIAHRIAALVCSSARYDTDTKPMPAGETDFALWFLKSSNTGYCVHFATAATVLLRAAGVPSRYVTGYMVAAEAGKTTAVTEEHAHAWAEYYEPLLGAWVVLEATPAEEPGETSVPSPPAVSDRISVDADDDSGPAKPENPLLSGPRLPLAEPDPQKLTGIARILIALAAMILIANIQRSTRVTVRRRLQRTGCPNEQALARWKEAELLSRLLGESPGEELAVLAQKAKFSPHDLTAEELQRFDSHCRSCLRQLRQRKWYRRLIDQYIHAVY